MSITTTTHLIITKLTAKPASTDLDRGASFFGTFLCPNKFAHQDDLLTGLPFAGLAVGAVPARDVRPDEPPLGRRLLCLLAAVIQNV